jgi:hypothetical protein
MAILRRACAGSRSSGVAPVSSIEFRTSFGARARSTFPQVGGSFMSSARNIDANRSAGVKGSCGLRQDEIAKKGCCLPWVLRNRTVSRATKFSKWSASGILETAPTATAPSRESSVRAPFHGSPPSSQRSSICGIPEPELARLNSSA